MRGVDFLEEWDRELQHKVEKEIITRVIWGKKKREACN